MAKPKRLTDAQRKIVEENYGLIKAYFKKHPLLDKEEWYDVLCIALCKAAMYYKPESGLFGFYVFACFGREILNTIQTANLQKRQTIKHLVYYEGRNDYEDEDEAESYREQILFRLAEKHSVENEAISRYMLDEYYRKKDTTGIDRKIFDLYKQGYTQAEIAENIGCTRANVSWVKRKIEKYLEKVS